MTHPRSSYARLGILTTLEFVGHTCRSWGCWIGQPRNKLTYKIGCPSWIWINPCIEMVVRIRTKLDANFWEAWLRTLLFFALSCPCSHSFGSYTNMINFNLNIKGKHEISP